MSALLRERMLKNEYPILRFFTNGGFKTINSDTGQVGCDEFIKNRNFPTAIEDILERTLLNLSRMKLDVETKQPKYGEMVSLKTGDYNIAFSRDDTSFRFVLQALMRRGFIDAEFYGDHVGAKITVEGWNHIAQRASGGEQSQQGFIAMSFDGDMKKIRGKIQDAIEGAGYKAQIIDEKPHTNVIDFEIAAEIKKSRFLVADLTKERPSVYYEAGYAHSLGVPVFLTSKKGEDIHFDLNHYPRIEWTLEDLDAFKKKLVAWSLSPV